MMITNFPPNVPVRFLMYSLNPCTSFPIMLQGAPSRTKHAAIDMSLSAALLGGCRWASAVFRPTAEETSKLVDFRRPQPLHSVLADTGLADKLRLPVFQPLRRVAQHARARCVAR